jgi:hypothetical protein
VTQRGSADALAGEIGIGDVEGHSDLSAGYASRRGQRYRPEHRRAGRRETRRGPDETGRGRHAMITVDLVGPSGWQGISRPLFRPAGHPRITTTYRLIAIAAARRGASPKDHTELGRRLTTRVPRTRRNPCERTPTLGDSSSRRTLTAGLRLARASIQRA